MLPAAAAHTLPQRVVETASVGLNIGRSAKYYEVSFRSRMLGLRS